MVWALAVGVSVASSAVAAQSLADIAKKEQARRDGVSEVGRTYTNADLAEDRREAPDAKPGVAPVTEPSTASVTVPADPAAAEPSSSEATPPESSLGEEYWRRQARARRARVAEAQERLARVPSAASSPGQQAKLDALKATLEAVLARAEASLADFQRQARDQNVPEAWIR